MDTTIFLQYQVDTQKLICQGMWTILDLPACFEQMIGALNQEQVVTIDAQVISQLDSAGAEYLLKLHRQFPKAALLLNDEQRRLFSLIQSYAVAQLIPTDTKKTHWLENFGEKSYQGYLELLRYLGFTGEVFCLVLGWLLRPQKILWHNIAKSVEVSGYYGLAIIGLLSFLVGVVLAYQMGVQLENYGANIFVVNLLGISILREFAPLMTAIIVAGRTGSAFTAELGTMKVNQELDALVTMGVKPIEFLVLPKILGLIIALPLLSMWAAFAGIFGGMFMAKSMLGITVTVFWHQFQEGVALKQLWIGLMKTPVFAFIIGSIGCFQGLQVSGGAESVGQQTTRSVVQALFLIIVADAFFSILLSIFHA